MIRNIEIKKCYRINNNSLSIIFLSKQINFLIKTNNSTETKHLNKFKDIKILFMSMYNLNYIQILFLMI